VAAHASPIEPSAPLSRRTRRRLEVRRRIVEAAVALFDEQGMAATTVAAICARADVANKTFFNHFPAKSDLLREIAQGALDDLLTDIEEARKAPGGTRERLRRLFEQIAEEALAAGPMHRELLAEIIHVAHESGTEREQARRLHSAFRGLVREGRSAGDVATAHTMETQTDMVVGAFYALMLNWANLDDYPLRRQAAAAARFLADALAPAPRGRRVRS
jgi:AcrR family transcriptional regulator